MPRVLTSCLIALSGLLPAHVRAQVLINEIMYNSVHAQDVEYVELFNAGATPQSLAGWTLIDDDDGHPACALAGTLAPGDFLVVAGDLALFQSTYPAVSNVNADAFGAGFGLGNASDSIRLRNDQGVLVDIVSYTDTAPWPVTADGGGPSLELKSPAIDNAIAASWAAGVVGGTPGEQNSVFVPDLPPQIAPPLRSIALPAAWQAVAVTAQVGDDHAVDSVALLLDTGTGFTPTPMHDDGLHGDGPAGDLRFGAIIDGKPDGTLVRYYVEATDSAAQQSVAPVGAPGDYLAYTVGHVPPPLSINEVLASNQNGIRDEALQRDDWLEIRNAGPDPVELGGMYLSQRLDDPRKWQIPPVTLAAGERLLVWCDDEPQGPFHASFGLAAAGDEVWLFDTVDHGNLLIHGFTFGVQSPDRSFGYRPEDGDAPEYLATPTPLASNHVSGLLSPVCINEFLTSSSVGTPDWIELFNRTGLTVDIGGWSLSDDATAPLEYTFPAGTLIAPGGTLSVSAATLGFALNNDGGEVLMLTRAGGTIGQDYFDFGPQSDDVSQGRYADGTANWHFFGNASRDLPNSCNQGVPPLGPVPGLRLESAVALAWDALGGATGYDVVRGDLELLRASAGDYAVAGTSCVENNGQDLRSWDTVLPPPGEGMFLLVRGTTASCGFGTYDASGAGQQGARDAEIAASGGNCP